MILLTRGVLLLMRNTVSEALLGHAWALALGMRSVTLGMRSVTLGMRFVTLRMRPVTLRMRSEALQEPFGALSNHSCLYDFLSPSHFSSGFATVP